MTGELDSFFYSLIDHLLNFIIENTGKIITKPRLLKMFI